MTLALITLTVALGLGLLLGGRLSNLQQLPVRWTWMALVGLALQMLPFPESAHVLAVGSLLASFVLLAVFALVNLRVAGVPLILAGLVLNFTVIAANGGMPVSGAALQRSGQQDTLARLEDGSPKHHLATSNDTLVFLGDVIPVGTPIHRVVSVGDILAHTGLAWLIVAGMRRRRPGAADPSPAGDHVAQPQPEKEPAGARDG